MSERIIKNFKELATTPNREIALEIVEAGYKAISTKKVIDFNVSLEDNFLIIKGKKFDLTKFKNIKIVGFGKSSCEAALALEKILGSKIESGVVIGLHKVFSQYIETYAGTHPKPSNVNIEAGKKIYELVKEAKEDDLIIAIVSGGGSALLCYSENESLDGAKIYDLALKSGKTITEINIIRKHLSILKGGGLAKIAYPATIIGLIFSDVPGDVFNDVASGPTYKDITTIEDAKKIIIENNFGEFNLIETPKEDKYFEKVYNFVLVSDKTAVEVMKKRATDFGLEVNIISTDLYDEINEALKKIFSAKKDNTVVLASGEPRIIVKDKRGKGGRNLHMGLSAIKNNLLDENSIFISFASDGMDNSDVAGAIIDKNTLNEIERLNLDVSTYLERFDSYNFFKKTNDLIITGPTDANVSDLMLLLTKK